MRRNSVYVAFILGGALLGERVSSELVLSLLPGGITSGIIISKGPSTDRLQQVSVIPLCRHSMQALTKCGQTTTRGCASPHDPA